MLQSTPRKLTEMARGRPPQREMRIASCFDPSLFTRVSLLQLHNHVSFVTWSERKIQIAVFSVWVRTMVSNSSVSKTPSSHRERKRWEPVDLKVREHVEVDPTG